jgi:hypothetical protein
MPEPKPVVTTDTPTDVTDEATITEQDVTAANRRFKRKRGKKYPLLAQLLDADVEDEDTEENP